MVEARAHVGAELQGPEPDFAARQSILWAIAWLVGGVALLFFAQMLPLVGDMRYLKSDLFDYARIRAIADTAITFGWLGTVGFAALYALLPRVTEVRLHNEVLGATTTLTWAMILTGGIGALLFGVSQGKPLAELPIGADAGLAFLLVLVLYNAAVTVVRRRERTLYVSGWFLLMAALLAPLVFIVGNLPAFDGVTAAIVGGFYMNGIEMLWLLPIALAVAYYVVPVETGKPLYSGALARTSFWSLVFAGGWTGGRYLLFGPAPEYLEAMSVAMTVVLLLPVLSAAANLFATGRDRWDQVSRSFGLRFAATGLGLLVVWVALIAFTTIPSVSRFVGLTAWQAGVRNLAIFGVFSSFAFALVYHVYPLMVGRDWYSRTAAAFHFWATQVGMLIGTVCLMAIGVAQSALGDTPPAEVNVITLLRWVVAASTAIVVAAQFALAYNTMRTATKGDIVQIVAGGRPTVARVS